MLVKYLTNKTTLTKHLYIYKIQKRTMQATRNLASRCFLTKNITPQNSTAYLQKTNERNICIRGGKLNMALEKTTAAGTSIQSDQTGFHKLAVAFVCKQTDCKHTNCAQGTAETNPCGISGEVHRASLEDPGIKQQLENAGIVMENYGALTHKIPKGKQGTIIGTEDINAKPEIQHAVHEPSVIPVSPTNFREEPVVSEYCQVNRHTANFVKNAPLDSIINLQDNSPTRINVDPIKPFNPIPTDDGF